MTDHKKRAESLWANWKGATDSEVVDHLTAVLVEDDNAFERAIGIAEYNARKIEALQEELGKRNAYTKGLEDDYSRQGLKARARIAALEAEVAALSDLCARVSEKTHG